MINPQVSQVPVVLAYKKDIEIDVWPHKVDMVHLFFLKRHVQIVKNSLAHPSLCLCGVTGKQFRVV